MNTKLQFLIAFLCLLFAPSIMHGQFILEAEIRPRGEFRNGFKQPRLEEADPAFFVEQRSRLYFGYRAERVKLQLNVQDIRIWGNADQIYKQDPALSNINEGWGEFMITDKFSAKIGRQVIAYDNERFLGGLGWAAQGRSHDAMLLKFEDDTSGWKVHLGGAFNQNVPFEPARLEGTFYSEVNNYKSMLYLWANKQWDFGKMTFMVHNDGRQVVSDSTTAFRQTYAVLGSFPLGESGLKMEGELYYQGGKNATRTDISAVFAALHITYKPGKHAFTFAGEYASGSAADDTKDKAWNPLYGTNHKFYGFMDYFYVGNGHGQNGRTSGLIDLHMMGLFQVGKGKLLTKVHNFSSPVRIFDPANPNEELSTQLGVEVDLVYNINVVPAVNIQGGYSQMFGTSSLEAIKGGGSANKFNNWIWLMVGFRPQLLNTSKK